jgi:hypothetical protein
VGSRERLAIESDACLSVRGVQVVPPFVVFQIPPTGVPTNKVFASKGSATTGPIAPTAFPFGGASPLPTLIVGPKLGDGPCVTKFWLTWSCAAAAVGSANAAAMTSQRNGLNMIRPPAAQDLTPPRLHCAKRIMNAMFELRFLPSFSLSVALEAHATLAKLASTRHEFRW